MSENDKLAALLGSAYLLKKADDKIDSLERKISDVNNTVKSLIKDNNNFQKNQLFFGNVSYIYCNKTLCKYNIFLHQSP